MGLPKIEHPTFFIEVPSTKKKVTFRPFLVKEEKMLLMAKASGQELDMLLAIKQIINNCAINEDFDINDLTLFDMEFLFLMIRAASVSDTIEVSYKDLEDEKTYDFIVDLKNITIDWPSAEISNIVRLTKSAGMTLRYPRANLYEDNAFLSAGKDTFFQLIIRCIDKIYDGDDVYDAKNYTPQELTDFIEDLDVKVFEEVNKFMTNQPTLLYTINYRNSLGHDRKIELRTLSDFFTLR